MHADGCSGYADTGSYPEGFRHRRQVLRACTAVGDMLANRSMFALRRG